MTVAYIIQTYRLLPKRLERRVLSAGDETTHEAIVYALTNSAATTVQQVPRATASTIRLRILTTSETFGGKSSRCLIDVDRPINDRTRKTRSLGSGRHSSDGSKTIDRSILTSSTDDNRSAFFLAKLIPHDSRYDRGAGCNKEGLTFHGHWIVSRCQQISPFID